jgi:proteasome accessory factor B
MAAQRQVKKEDRLFSLILALSASRDGLTKTEILRSVRGYSDRYTFSANPTLDKLFERDKQELRSMGAVIDTFEFAGEEGETHNVRYVISRERYEFPAGISFGPSEVALLNIASQAWREASLNIESRHALNKIRSFGVVADDSLIGVAPRIRTMDQAFPALADALDNNRVVSFLYLKPGDRQARQRHCAPLALVNWRDRWYTLAFDTDVQQERTFLLSRIVSTPARVTQQTWERPEVDYAGRLIAELNALALENEAKFRVDHSTAAASVLQSWGAQLQPDETMSMSFSDINLLADELVPLSSELTVIEPLALQELLRERLTRIALMHVTAVPS